MFIFQSRFKINFNKFILKCIFHF